MNLAASERAGLCDLLEDVGPDAPTLCEGWTTFDLLAHLWVRETDPLAAPGLALRPLAHITAKRMADAKEKQGFEGLLAAFRKGPSGMSVFAIPGADEAANASEFFVHHEDVRRASTPPAQPRDFPAEVEEFFWRRLRLMGRKLVRRSPVGLVLERDDEPDEPLRVVPGSRTVTLIGRPSELTLAAFGRQKHAIIRTVGEPDATAALLDQALGL